MHGKDINYLHINLLTHLVLTCHYFCDVLMCLFSHAKFMRGEARGGAGAGCFRGVILTKRMSICAIYVLIVQYFAGQKVTQLNLYRLYSCLVYLPSRG